MRLQAISRSTLAGGLVLGAASVGAALCVPGDAWTLLRAPTSVAIYAYTAFVICVAAARWRGAVRAERRLMAAFLASMPLVYVASAVEAGGQGLGLELLGLALFGGLAVAGLRRPALIAAGIALHGLGWDLWHRGHEALVPGWYPWACLIADLGVGAYAALRWGAAPIRRGSASTASLSRTPDSAGG